jgi:hypothetical protein
LISKGRGFTPAFWDQGQRVLGLPPHSTHELPVLLAAFDRSGLRSSFPARPICCSAFQPWSASLALPTAGPTMPSADFCFAVRRSLGRLSRFVATQSRSPGVSSIAFGAQPPDLRFAPLMDMDFAIRCPLVRRWRLASGFCPSARTFVPRFLQTPPRGDSPCASLTLHLHQVE